MPLDWDKLNVRVNPSGRVRCEPGWRLRADWVEKLTDFDFWFVWAGRGVIRLVDQTVELMPGVGIWARPGRFYEAEQDASDRLGVSFIHFELLDRRGRATLTPPASATRAASLAGGTT